jgi:hypothetical protein
MKVKKENKYENHRVVASLVKKEGEYGKFFELQADNAYPETKDGEDNPYHKGDLLWYDKETNVVYKVLSLKVFEASEKQKSVGIIKKASIDLDNKYQVKKVKKG